jgi:uncharacterized protein YecE (DUF72 family)
VLAGALEQLPPGRHCFEFRHPSWFAADVMSLLRRERGRAGAGRPSGTPLSDRRADHRLDAVEVPLGRERARGNYSETELDEWAVRLDRLRKARGGLRLLQQRLGGVRRSQRAGVGRPARRRAVAAGRG